MVCCFTTKKIVVYHFISFQSVSCDNVLLCDTICNNIKTEEVCALGNRVSNASAKIFIFSTACPVKGQAFV